MAARSTTVHQLLWWGEYAGIENECVPSIVKSCTSVGLEAYCHLLCQCRHVKKKKIE